MALFLVQISFVPERFTAVRPRHREYLSKLAENDVCMVAGPFTDDSGGAMMFEAANTEELMQILDEDPYYVEGAVAERSVRELSRTIGSWVH